VAKGKGIEVKRSQIDAELIRVKSQAASSGQTVPPEQVAMMEPRILDQIIDIQLLMGKATEADKTTGKALAVKNFDEAKAQLGSDDSVTARLKAMGTTREELVAKWTEGRTAETVLKRELKVTVTDDDVKKFYDDNPAQFEKAEMVRASHILLSTRDASGQGELPAEKKTEKRKQAEDILKRARAGEDFAKLAKEYSEDPGSKDKGGEYTFPKGRMVPEFEAAAFSLQPGQISDVVTTQFGFHIIKLSEKLPAKKDDLASVSTKVKDYLIGQAIQKQAPDYLKKLRSEASVEILDEKLKVKEMPETGALPAGHPPVAAPQPADKK
jgi:peptidyl-prolyl cis-trans isomerase C